MARNDELYEAVLKGRRNDVATIVQKMVDEECNVEEILMDSISAPTAK